MSTGEFAPFLTENDEEKIKANFTQKPATPDDDINVSVDQTENLTSAIARGMSYPTLDINGNVDYNELMNFLERMCRVFKWEKYERQTLGRVSKKNRKARNASLVCCYIDSMDSGNGS